VSTLEQTLASARAEGRAALIAYLPAGYPSVEGSIAAMRAVVEAGADIVEVGFPYSDPLMDGPTIQAAADVAVRAGIGAGDVLRVVHEVAATGAPALVMSYWNPLEHYGVERWSADLAAAGGAGMITPDITPDEAAPWLAAAAATGLDRVFLVAPSSTDERLAYTTEHCSGFVYAASTMGVTGTRTSVGDAAAALVERTRRVTDLPVCVGLGVSNGEQAAQVAGFADGVIVGSALVRALLDAASLDEGLDALRRVTADLADGVRAGRPPVSSGEHAKRSAR
jgi:tryptophan synthase alpha chain